GEAHASVSAWTNSCPRCSSCACCGEMGDLAADAGANPYRPQRRRACKWHQNPLCHVRPRLAGHFLHGGLANTDYWGDQVPAVAAHHTVILMDSRGHGRSTRDARPYGYDLMADDVTALMDSLKIAKADIVGWSDGAILGIDLAMRHKAGVRCPFGDAEGLRQLRRPDQQDVGRAAKLE